MPVAFFYLFNTDDHIDRVYKELKQVCFILIVMYMYSHSKCAYAILALNSLMSTVASGLKHFNLYAVLCE